MALGYQQVLANTAIKSVTALTVPAGTQRAALQADTAGNIRYTMDGVVAVNTPSTTLGVILAANTNPQIFLAADIQNIQFIAAAANTNLNIQYF